MYLEYTYDAYHSLLRIYLPNFNAKVLPFHLNTKYRRNVLIMFNNMEHYSLSLSNALCKSSVLLPNRRRKRSRALRRLSGIRAYKALSGVSLLTAFLTAGAFMPLARRSLLLCDIVFVNDFCNVRIGTCLPRGTSVLRFRRLYSKPPRLFGRNRERMLYGSPNGATHVQGY